MRGRHGIQHPRAGQDGKVLLAGPKDVLGHDGIVLREVQRRAEATGAKDVASEEAESRELAGIVDDYQYVS
jgi:hypothetical protein